MPETQPLNHGERDGKFIPLPSSRLSPKFLERLANTPLPEAIPDEPDAVTGVTIDLSQHLPENLE